MINMTIIINNRNLMHTQTIHHPNVHHQQYRIIMIDIIHTINNIINIGIVHQHQDIDQHRDIDLVAHQHIIPIIIIIVHHHQDLIIIDIVMMMMMMTVMKVMMI